MSDLNLKYHPEAAAEALDAVRWYADKSRDVALKFNEALSHAERRVVERPEFWGTYFHGTRCCKLKGFPYGLIYQQRAGYLLVLAVAHLHRMPGYWKERGT